MRSIIFLIIVLSLIFSVNGELEKKYSVELNYDQGEVKLKLVKVIPSLEKLLLQKNGDYKAELRSYNGDLLEAQAFGYLAIRRLKKLPISLPTTTGVKTPITGGKIYK